MGCNSRKSEQAWGNPVWVGVIVSGTKLLCQLSSLLLTSFITMRDSESVPRLWRKSKPEESLVVSGCTDGQVRGSGGGVGPGRALQGLYGALIPLSFIPLSFPHSPLNAARPCDSHLLSGKAQQVTFTQQPDTAFSSADVDLKGTFKAK